MSIDRFSLGLRCGALVVVFGLTLPLSGAAQDVERMDEIVRYYVDNQMFMGSVLVARNGEVLLNEGYGSANLEWDVPNTPTTKFRLGSITKQFTAAAILLLEEQGKLTLDDLVKVHMPDAPAAWDAVTIYHVLTHTAGIPSFTSFPEYGKLKLSPSPVATTVALFRDKPLDFAPGERMSYSNSGYVLLGYLVERISGQSYEVFLREHIFAPLVMQDSGYDTNATILPGRAAGYTPSPNGIVNAAFIDMTIPHGAGALYSTTEDLLRWTEGLFGGKLLSAESIAKMTTPFKNDYAFGVTVTETNGRTVVQHSGGIEGFNTHLAYHPDEELTVVALANVNGGMPGQIAAQLAAVVRGETVTLPSERVEISLPPEVLSEYEGTYQFGPAFAITIFLGDGGLISQATGQPTVPIYALGDDKFFPRVVDAELEFVRGEGGEIEALILRQGGRETRAPRR
jgi:CubicO group peptidase (beta-lactamase class C family)